MPTSPHTIAPLLGALCLAIALTGCTTTAVETVPTEVGETAEAPPTDLVTAGAQYSWPQPGEGDACDDVPNAQTLESITGFTGLEVKLDGRTDDLAQCVYSVVGTRTEIAFYSQWNTPLETYTETGDPGVYASDRLEGAYEAHGQFANDSQLFAGAGGHSYGVRISPLVDTGMTEDQAFDVTAKILLAWGTGVGR